METVASSGARLLLVSLIAAVSVACVEGGGPGAPSGAAVAPCFFDGTPADFTPRPIPESGRLSVFRPHFDRYLNVFGVWVVATPATEAAKVSHAGTILAEWIDNDEDGLPDDAAAHAALVVGGAFLVMPTTEDEMEELHESLSFDELEEAGFHIGQDLYGEETFPAGPPHLMARGRFDAALEEVLDRAEDPREREGWIRNASPFTWRACAVAHLAAWRTILHGA